MNANSSSATATVATSATDRLPNPTFPEWPELVPLIREGESAPYPIHRIPDTLRKAITEVQEFTQAPLAMVATAAITAVAACVQSHFDVERAESLEGPTSLYGLILADSGERKTTVEAYFKRPIDKHDKDHRVIGQKDLERFHHQREFWEAEKTRLMRGASSKEGGASSQDLLQDHLENVPKEPKVPKILATDITPEQLAYLLVNAWPTKYLSTSEGGIIFGGHGMKPDNILKNLAVLNSAWDGRVDGVDRRTTDSYPATDGVRVSASIMAQPSVIQSFLEKSGTLARGSGFLARFLVCWPQSTQGHRPFRHAPLDWPSLRQLNIIMAGLLSRSPKLDEEGHLEPAMLCLSSEAFKAWVEVYNQIEADLRKGGDLHEVRDSASKAADNVARVAAVFHCAESRTGKIEADHIEAAAAVVAWHLNEAKRLFNELALPVGVMRAKVLADWLIRECRVTETTSVTTRKISQYAPNQVRNKAERDAAIELLEDAGYIRLIGEGRSKYIELNPALLAVTP